MSAHPVSHSLSWRRTQPRTGNRTSVTSKALPATIDRLPEYSVLLDAWHDVHCALKRRGSPDCFSTFYFFSVPQPRPMYREQPGCLLALLRLLGISFPATPEKEDEISWAELDAELPYRIRDDFLSPSERSFFSALTLAVQNRAIICPKVRMGDILYTTDRRQFWKHTNRVNQKHVDFLLCSCDSVQPLVVIELDDSSHQREDRQNSDRFKNGAFEAAGIPLVRFAVRRSYEPAQVLSRLLPFLDPTAVAGAVPYASAASDACPTCPKCGIPMVTRMASRGGKAGQAFFGCLNFPKCREIIELFS